MSDYAAIARALVGARGLMSPRSVVDVGCGPGGLLAALRRELPGLRVAGIEAPPLRRQALEAGPLISEDEYIWIDLRQPPVPPPERFDLAISTEVAEHLPPAAAERYVRFLSALAGVVVFTHALPGQYGVGHVNEQPLGYWEALFDRAGMGLDLVTSRELQAAVAPSVSFPWYRRLQVFRAALDARVVLQTVAARARARIPTLRSIANSDIGNNFSILHGNCGDREGDPQAADSMTFGEHLATVLRSFPASGKPWGIWLEDDVLLNEQILHNLARWEATRKDNFGVGWLFLPFGTSRDGNRLGRDGGELYRRLEKGFMHVSVAVLFRSDLCNEIADRITVIDPCGVKFDLSVSEAVLDMERRCYLHEPSLAEHRIDIPSTLGHEHPVEHHTTNGHFDPKWCR